VLEQKNTTKHTNFILQQPIILIYTQFPIVVLNYYLIRINTINGLLNSDVRKQYS